MNEYGFTEDQILIQESARQWAAENLAPTVMERDHNDVFDRELVNKLMQMGFCGLAFPEEFGGTGNNDYLAYILALEELCKVDNGIATTFMASMSLGASPILDFGTEEQKKKYLTPLASGEKLGAFALTEAAAGSDAASQKTVAVLEGDHYVLNGSKIFITNAGEAEIYIVFAMTDPSKGVKGITAFILEKGMEGFTFGNKEHKMGLRTSITMELAFKDVKVPVENRLGEEGQGFKIAMHTLDGGRIGVGAQAVGLAAGALGHAISYAKEREQFGKPISANQAISFKLADMATRVEAARLLVYKAATLKQNGLPYGRDAAMAKMFASDVAMWVTTEAVQVYGGYGYSEEFPVARYMRDAKITQIYEGTNEVQHMVVAGAILR